MTIDETKEKLQSKKSADRRRAAKEIRKSRLSQLGDVLYEAYLKERKDARTWETQSEMLFALGMIGYQKAFAEIDEIVQANAPRDMITSRASQAWVQLKREHLNDATPIITLLKQGSYSVVTGALCVLAIDQMQPSQAELEEILALCWNIHKHPDRLQHEFGLVDPRLYLVLMLPEWECPSKQKFLEHCTTATYINRFGVEQPDQHLIELAEKSLKGKKHTAYLKNLE